MKFAKLFIVLAAFGVLSLVGCSNTMSGEETTKPAPNPNGGGPMTAPMDGGKPAGGGQMAPRGASVN
jgi:hypothetical protein